MNTSQSEQAAKHEPSEMIRQTLALSKRAALEINNVRALLKAELGTEPEPGAHLRNAAIFTLEYAAANLERVQFLAQEASAAESTAQQFERNREAYKARNGAPTLPYLAERFAAHEKDMIAYQESAAQLAAHCAEYARVAICEPLAAVRHIISQLCREVYD